MIKYNSFNFNDFDLADTVFVADAIFADRFSDNCKVFLLNGGENDKSFAKAAEICKFLLESGMDRKGTIVAVGGGSVGDLAGFCAGIFKRGVRFVNYPTTLLGMVDSGIGGKTAVNLDGIKNAVGLFKKTETVIDFDFLFTLKPEQLSQGMGEIVKYSFLDKEIDDYLNKLSKNGQFYDKKLIKLCAEFKQKICDKDFFDMCERQILNAGHTLGHAFEILYSLPHGIAVANGLYYELSLAYELNLITSQQTNDMQSKIKRFFSIIPINVNLIDAIVDKCSLDKKNVGENIGFIIALADYKTVQVKVKKDELKAFLQKNSSNNP